MSTLFDLKRKAVSIKKQLNVDSEIIDRVISSTDVSEESVADLEFQLSVFMFSRGIDIDAVAV